MFAKTLIAQLSKQPLPEAMLLNVNVPPVKPEEIAGVRITRQGLRRYIDTFEKRVDPRGKTYYWLAGEVLQDVEQPTHLHLPDDVPTDVQAIRDKYITITPLQYNLTDTAGVYCLQKLGFGNGELGMGIENSQLPSLLTATTSVVKFNKSEKPFTEFWISCSSLHLFGDFFNSLHPVGTLTWRVVASAM
jgi:hypothetical protein